MNKLLNNIKLRNELTKETYLLDTMKIISLVPNKSDLVGLFTITEAAQFYKTKTQLITEILEKYSDEFIVDGYKQYTQLEILEAYMKCFIPLKEIKKIETIRNYIEIYFKDNTIIQITNRGRYLLTKPALLRIACFLENSSIAKDIRELFLENKMLDNQLINKINTELFYKTIQSDLIEKKVRAELARNMYTLSNINHKLFLLKNEKIKGNKMGKVIQITHPLIQHKLALLRDKNTGSKDFRELLDEVAMLMAYEVTRDFKVDDVAIETPIQKTKCKMLSGKKVAIVPVLRAGLGMVNGILRLIPAAKVGHIGMYRDEETLKPVEYFCKLPLDISEREVIVPKLMLATGGSFSDALSLLKRKGAVNIRLMCLVTSKEGLDVVHKNHPDVDIYTVAIDSVLNEHGYIVPGLGDAGDRMFGIK